MRWHGLLRQPNFFYRVSHPFLGRNDADEPPGHLRQQIELTRSDFERDGIAVRG